MMLQVHFQHSSIDGRDIRRRRIPIRITFPFLCICLCLLGSYLPAYADNKEGASLFQSKCAGCHTIGKGALVGPDLAATKNWADADLESNVKRMEKTVGLLSPDEVSSLVSFLKNPGEDSGSLAASTATNTATTGGTSSVGESKSTGPAAEMKDQSAPSPEDLGSAKEGSDLFDGSRSFTNGGMSCNACHTANGNGNSMGPDLGNIAEKMNDAALRVACQQTPFKVMKAAYAEHPVTKQEAASLVKFFDSIKGRRVRSERIPLTVCSAAGAALMLLLVAFGYRNRNTDVRKKLHRR